MSAILKCTNLVKSFGTGHAAQSVLAGVSVCFSAGEACVLLGPSGSGKTTLLSIFGCLLSPDEGELHLEGKPVDFRAKGRLASLRRTKIGFVFQQAQLLPFLNVEENLSVVGRNSGLSYRSLRTRIKDLLDRLGLMESRYKLPGLLSGGERQRVAIARAVLHCPPVLLADEPTAALDWSNGQTVIQLLVEQTRETGALLVTVTHDTRLLPNFLRVLRIDAGRIVEEP